MITALISLLSLVNPASALAYSPELLLGKVIVPTQELSAPGTNQFLNPFSQVQAGYTRLDMTRQRHEFALTLKPKGISEAIEYKKFASSLGRDIGVSQKLLRSKSLQTAYDALISAALAKEQNSSATDLKNLLEKSQRLSAIEASLSLKDVKNVLKSKADLQKSVREMIETEAQLAGIKQFLHNQGLNIDELDTSDLMDPEDISAAIASLPVTNTALSAQKINTSLEVTRGNARHAIAARSKLLDDVKLAMREERKEKSYRVEVSINLPFLAAQNLDDYRDNLKVAEAEVEGQAAMLEENLKSAGLAEVLKQKISLYKAMGASPKYDNSALLSQDPVLALDLQRSSVALRLGKASLLAEIRTLYVRLLFETEVLADAPETNHLSRAKRKI